MKEIRVSLQERRIHPWAISAEDILRELKTDPIRGLSLNEVEHRRRTGGANVFQEETGPSPLRILGRQFRSPVVLILLIGAGLSIGLGEFIDATAISAILVANAVIGFFQEWRAERAVAALKRLASPRVRVVREGAIGEIRSEEVCAGDILVLEAGDWVAADARLLEASQLSSNEAVLTGESLPVEKQTAPVPADTVVPDRTDMIFGGTTILTGSGRAVVTAIGMSTEMGRIAEMLRETRPGPTPLQQRLEHLSRRLLWLCGVVIAVIAALGLVHGRGWIDVGMSAISLAVAAVPEGLPTVVTIALALAVRRMARRNAIVRHLPAVETLGSTDVICADKTGTLTTGRMRVREILFEGHIWPADEDLTDSASFRRLIRAIVQCNNASLTAGDPTEIALLELAQQHGLLEERRPRAFELPFDSSRKRMSVAVEEDGKRVLYVKGAPESVLPRCRPKGRERVDRLSDELLSMGRRVLAVAARPLEAPSEDVEKDLELLGLVALADPPRPEALEAVRRCRQAGIRVVMITGDHPKTARAVAVELGIAEPGDESALLTGAELDAMSPQILEPRVGRIAVFARVLPEHKLKIVRAYKNTGRVVAMTGDGVNDAPALKEASIGVSMGKTGAEVARQASAMILTDDNFATIVSAIEEGRAIYSNIRRTIQYLLSCNFAEILVMLAAAIGGLGVPLLPIQLLWINLVTDGLPALALAAEPVPKEGMEQTRRPSTELDRRFYGGVLAVGALVAVMAFGVYAYGLATRDPETARTYIFSFLVFEELFRSFSARSETKTFLQMGARTNLFLLAAVSFPILIQLMMHHTRYLDEWFGVGPIGGMESLALFGLSLVPVTILEVAKLGRKESVEGS